MLYKAQKQFTSWVSALVTAYYEHTDIDNIIL